MNMQKRIKSLTPEQRERHLSGIIGLLTRAEDILDDLGESRLLHRLEFITSEIICERDYLVVTELSEPTQRHSAGIYQPANMRGYS